VAPIFRQPFFRQRAIERRADSFFVDGKIDQDDKGQVGSEMQNLNLNYEP
jgi:hypothetical protein